MPTDESPLQEALLDVKGAAVASVPWEEIKAQHDAARKCAYVYYFSCSMAWGIWSVVYTYFLEGVGGMSSSRAASISTFQWLAYATAQVLSNPVLGTLSDTIGRRPVLLLGASINCVLLVAYCTNRAGSGGCSTAASWVPST